MQPHSSDRLCTLLRTVKTRDDGDYREEISAHFFISCQFQIVTEETVYSRSPHTTERI